MALRNEEMQSVAVQYQFGRQRPHRVQKRARGPAPGSEGKTSQVGYIRAGGAQFALARDGTEIPRSAHGMRAVKT
mgnify:CR=1 FL=1